MGDFADPGGMVGYIQVRNADPTVTGRGKYLSFVHYGNGVGWVFGQPEKLPLGGQGRLTADTRRVFICEGPKAMAGAIRQVAEKPDHPWAKALTGAAIISWPEGRKSSLGRRLVSIRRAATELRNRCRRGQ